MEAHAAFAWPHMVVLLQDLHTTLQPGQAASTATEPQHPVSAPQQACAIEISDSDGDDAVPCLPGPGDAAQPNASFQVQLMVSRMLLLCKRCNISASACTTIISSSQRCRQGFWLAQAHTVQL